LGIVSRETTCWSNPWVERNAFRRCISCNDTSSTVESSCVTRIAIRSILACRLELLCAIDSASEKRFPNISSACFERDDSCRMILAKLPLVTPSSSSGTGTCRVPRDTLTGSTNRSGNGISALKYAFWKLSFGKPLHHRQLVRRRYDGVKAEVRYFVVHVQEGEFVCNLDYLYLTFIFSLHARWSGSPSHDHHNIISNNLQDFYCTHIAHTLLYILHTPYKKLIRTLGDTLTSYEAKLFSSKVFNRVFAQ